MAGESNQTTENESILKAHHFKKRGRELFETGNEPAAIKQYHNALKAIGAEVPDQAYTGEDEKESYGQSCFEDLEDPVLAGDLLICVAECYFRIFFENVARQRPALKFDAEKNFKDPFGLSHGHAMSANQRSIEILEKCLDEYIFKSGFVGLHERRKIANLLRRAYDIEIDNLVDFSFLLGSEAGSYLYPFKKVMQFRSFTFLEALWQRRSCLIKLASEDQLNRMSEEFIAIWKRWNAIGIRFGYLRDAIQSELAEEDPRKEVIDRLLEIGKTAQKAVQNETAQLQSVMPSSDDILSPLFKKFFFYNRSNDLGGGFIAVSQLSKNDILIQYHETSRQLVAFVYDPSYQDAEDCVSLALLSQHPIYVAEKLEKFNNQIKRRSAGWRQTASELYLDLIAPLSPYLRKKNRICIVPSGSLNTLSFQILIDPLKGDLPLINILPHAELLGWLMAAPVTSEKAARLLSVGINSFKSMPNLKNAESEARKVATHFGNNAMILLGSKGTAQKAKILYEMPRHEIVHIASHASFDRRAMNSSIFVKDKKGDDIAISGFDLLQPEISLDGALVVLSACNTGGMQTGRGEDPLGLASALFIAGARALLVSHWPVSDQATELIIERFYQYISDGVTADTALANATQWMRDARPEYKHPFYWGAFAIMGDGRWRLPEFEIKD